MKPLKLSRSLAFLTRVGPSSRAKASTLVTAAVLAAAVLAAAVLAAGVLAAGVLAAAVLAEAGASRGPSKRVATSAPVTTIEIVRMTRRQRDRNNMTSETNLRRRIGRDTRKGWPQHLPKSCASRGPIGRELNHRRKVRNGCGYDSNEICPVTALKSASEWPNRRLPTHGWSGEVGSPGRLRLVSQEETPNESAH
jgi:hypothetical protein